MIVVDPEWWKTLFDEVYLLTDAEFVCNPALTTREVDVVEQMTPLRPADRMLDLCGGQGRHALELARRGYRHVTVLDYTMFLLQRGLHESHAAHLPGQFCRGDARALPFPAACFDVVLLMANSFGYFVNAADDRRVLAEAARVLRHGGHFVLDLTDYEHANRHFVQESWHEKPGGIVVCWKRELERETIRVREMVLSKTTGLLRDRTYAERLYAPEHLRTLLHEAGFTRFAVHPNAFVFEAADDTDYGIAAHRMLITACKA